VTDSALLLLQLSTLHMVAVSRPVVGNTELFRRMRNNVESTKNRRDGRPRAKFGIAVDGCLSYERCPQHPIENGYTTLCAARFCCGSFLHCPFCCWSILERTFLRKFYENIFSFAFIVFLIHKKIFFRLHFFFQKQSKVFCLSCNKFLSTLRKKIQIQTHRYCFFIRLFQ